MPEVVVIDACQRQGRGGSPTAVLDEASFTDEERCRIPGELGTSHAVFIRATGVERGRPSYSLRFFTAEGELPACGHGTVAALALLAVREGGSDHHAVLCTTSRSFEGRAIRNRDSVTASFDPGPVNLRVAQAPELRAVTAGLGLADEARRHLALVLRGRRRDPGLDDQVVAAAISTHCLDISEPKTTIGLEAGYRLCTARWPRSDLPARRRPPAPAPDPDRQPPADPGESTAHRPQGQDAGEWHVPRVPLQYERAVLAGGVLREKLRITATATTAVWGRAYDVVAHQQAAMPEQMLAPEPADPEHDDQEPKAAPGEAIDMTALRACETPARTWRPSISPPTDCAASRKRPPRWPTTPAPAPTASLRTAPPHRPTPTRCVRTTSRRTAHSSPDRTAAGRPATEWTRWCAPGGVMRTDDAPPRGRSPVTQWRRAWAGGPLRPLLGDPFVGAAAVG
ncbi:PhzF family phenazine biosynthesis protein, partial [Streptomyces sp. NPDC059783]|uniref:PhzF family phenazine biosynthesis protein n=1 Tax=Streptomyces sp. NPDC059783 TaxID=3346944 RepID=UPI0036661696